MLKSCTGTPLGEEHRMANAGGSRFPAQLEGRLFVEMKASGHVTISARDDALHVEAPFGALVIPYSRIDSVTQDVTGGIRIDAGGAKTHLDISDFSGRVALFRTLQDRATRARRWG